MPLQNRAGAGKDSGDMVAPQRQDAQPVHPPASQTGDRRRLTSRFLALVRRAGKLRPRPTVVEPDPLLAFGSEAAPAAPPLGGQRRSRPPLWAVLPTAGLVILALAGYAYSTGGVTSVAPAHGTGRLTIASQPAGAEAIIDGTRRGLTPTTIELPAGAHVLEVRTSGERRMIPLTIRSGGDLSHYIELPAPAPSTGQLRVDAQLPGARVTVDGEPRGVAPIAIADLKPGPHDVVVTNDTASVRRAVTVEAGATASLLITLGNEGQSFGWMAISAPVPMQVFEGDRLLGTTAMERIAVGSGTHEIELVNDDLKYRRRRPVHIDPDKTLSFKVELPKGLIHINADPWAEVTVDGHGVGETPIGNLELSLGSHEVVFRHPQLGERRETVLVTADAPARLGVDLHK